MRIKWQGQVFYTKLRYVGLGCNGAKVYESDRAELADIGFYWDKEARRMKPFYDAGSVKRFKLMAVSGYYLGSKR